MPDIKKVVHKETGDVYNMYSVDAREAVTGRHGEYAYVRGDGVEASEGTPPPHNVMQNAMSPGLVSRGDKGDVPKRGEDGFVEGQHDPDARDGFHEPKKSVPFASDATRFTASATDPDIPPAVNVRAGTRAEQIAESNASGPAGETVEGEAGAPGRNRRFVKGTGESPATGATK